MSRVAFAKYQASGNDFLILDEVGAYLEAG